MDFGDRIKYLREEKQITRKELSKKLNITYSSLSKYESNTRFPDKNTLAKIADFFDVSLDYLLGRSTIKNSDIKFNEIDLNLIESLNDLNDDENKKKVQEYIRLLKLSEKDQNKKLYPLQDVN